MNWAVGWTVLLATLAQAPAPAPEQQPVAAVAGAEQAAELPLLAGTLPDLEIHALVHIDELTFREAPEVRVTFAGEPTRSTVDRSERENLPEKVDPGVTYRDVWLRLTISSTFAIPGITAPEEGTVPAPSPEPSSEPSSTPPAPEDPQ